MTRQIVNANDKVIALKDRADIDYAVDIYRVAALWITNSKGDVLLAQRSKNIHNDAGLWGPAVAGTVEEGETYESNIYKEAEEEIGLRGTQFAKGPKVFVEGSRSYFCQAFTAIVDQDADLFELQVDEVEAVRWFPIQELIRDVQDNPQNYVEKMEDTVKLFATGVKT